MKQERRGFLANVGKVGLLALAASIDTQTWANQTTPLAGKVVRLIVPFGPGGTGDMLARLMGAVLTEGLGASAVVVENKVGAGGTIGAAYVAKAAPDGLTLGLATASTHAISPAVSRHPKYDPIRDFAPVALIANVPVVLVASSATKLDSIAALLAAIRGKTRSVSYGSPGVGSLGHILGEQLQQLTGTSMLHVPYKSAAEVARGLLGGEVDLAFDNLPTSLEQIRAGKFTLLAVTGTARNPEFPKAPTFAQLGYDALNDPSWFGLVLPAGAAPALVDAYNTCAVRALRTSAIKKRINTLGGEPAPISAQDFRALIQTTYARTQAIAQARGIFID